MISALYMQFSTTNICKKKQSEKLFARFLAIQHTPREPLYTKKIPKIGEYFKYCPILGIWLYAVNTAKTLV